MGTRTVRLSDETYELVEARKSDDETIEEAIERLVRRGKVPLTSIAGIVDEDDGEAAKEAIEQSRRDGRAKLDRLAAKRERTSVDDS